MPNQVRKLRANAGLSQRQLSKLIDKPVGTVRWWEGHEDVTPHGATLPLLAAALNCSMTDILGIEPMTQTTAERVAASLVSGR